MWREQALVTKEMDVSTAMKARAVCKSWKRLVKEADLEPLEAGGSDAEAMGETPQYMDPLYEDPDQILNLAVMMVPVE